MKTLGLDLGSRTLGVSVSDVLGMIARPVETIRFADDDYDSAFEQVKKYIKEFQVKTVVLGRKRNNVDIFKRKLFFKLVNLTDNFVKTLFAVLYKVAEVEYKIINSALLAFLGEST